jgi:DNA modification methylase
MSIKEKLQSSQKTTTEIKIGTKSKIVLPTYIGEFWTSKQRKGNALHEVPYRACFKPQLPKFFIEAYTKPGEVVYDPFMGRGTTLIEAALLGRRVMGNDKNPSSIVLSFGRFFPPSIEEIENELNKEFPSVPVLSDDPMLIFYHLDTLKELLELKAYLNQTSDNKLVKHWIDMVALTRLTGHSSGFFSAYTLPPNQAASIKAQKKINQKKNQRPPRRDIKKLIIKKSKTLMKDLTEEDIDNLLDSRPEMYCGDARNTKVEDESVNLIVTSPPFLDVVDYKQDNWVRNWFMEGRTNNEGEFNPDQFKKVEDWNEFITEVFVDLKRVLKKGGKIAFEVGEVKKGKVKLEEEVVRCAYNAGLKPKMIVINQQNFTKTSNIWGVDNNSKGTNSNRIVVIGKE